MIVSRDGEVRSYSVARDNEVLSQFSVPLLNLSIARIDRTAHPHTPVVSLQLVRAASSGFSIRFALKIPSRCFYLVNVGEGLFHILSLIGPRRRSSRHEQA